MGREGLTFFGWLEEEEGAEEGEEEGGGEGEEEGADEGTGHDAGEGEVVEEGEGGCRWVGEGGGEGGERGEVEEVVRRLGVEAFFDLWMRWVGGWVDLSGFGFGCVNESMGGLSWTGYGCSGALRTLL